MGDEIKAAKGVRGVQCLSLCIYEPKKVRYDKMFMRSSLVRMRPRNLRGGRWSSAEYSTKKKNPPKKYLKKMFIFSSPDSSV